MIAKSIILSLILLSANSIAQEHQAVIAQAKTCFESEDFACVETQLEKALTLVPPDYDKVWLYRNLSIAQVNLGKNKEAIKSISNALKLDKTNAGFHRTRASIYQEMQKPKKALKDCNQAIKLKPQASENYLIRGNILVDLEEYDQASDDYFLALKLDSKNINALFNLGYLYIEMDSLNKALEIHDKLLGVYKDKAPASSLAVLYNNRADVLIKKQEYKAAKADIEKSLTLDENCVSCYLTYGEYYLAQNQDELACENFYRAISLGFDEKLIKDYLKHCDE